MSAPPLQQLQAFADCLPPPSECVLFIGVDDDDPFFAQAPESFWKDAFPEYDKAGHVVVKLFAPTSPPAICAIARSLASHAFQFKPTRCTLFALLGDDVSISPKKTWLTPVRAEFEETAKRLNNNGTDEGSGDGICVPIGFGRVCLRDTAFIGFPTFPIVGHPHLEAFGGLLSPVDFVNQDADPFTFEVYRRFGAATYAKGVALCNGIGGDEGSPARYQRAPTPGWKDHLLEEGVRRVASWLSKSNSDGAVRASLVTTLDVVVPSFRTPEALLRRIVALAVPEAFSTQFVIILDSPGDEASNLRASLEGDFQERVRVRVNASNVGASQTRNRGLDESSAQWVVFLDDDIEPHPSLLLEYATAITTHGDEAAGFVGDSRFPDHLAASSLSLSNNGDDENGDNDKESILATGLAMSYLTYFWGLARLEVEGLEAPWGVTANVCTRRTRQRFDPRFPKTGGGEDIDYERRVVRATGGLKLLKAPNARATHPYWNCGHPCPWRFYHWALGDTLLMDADLYPEHVFASWPNAWELSALLSALLLALLFFAVLCAIVEGGGDWVGDIVFKLAVSAGEDVAVGGGKESQHQGRPQLPTTAAAATGQALARILSSLCAVWLAEVGLDVNHLMVADPFVAPHATGARRAHAALVSCVYKNFNEFGHFSVATLRRGRLGRRFDWSFGLWEHKPLTKAREGKRAAFLGAAAFLGLALGGGGRCLLVLASLLGALCFLAAWTFHAPFLLATTTTTTTTNTAAPNTENTIVASPTNVPTTMLLAALSLPPPPPPTLNFAYICEGNYVRALAVSVLSLLEAHRSGSGKGSAQGTVNIFVLDAGIDDGDWAKLEATVLCDNFSVFAALFRVPATYPLKKAAAASTSSSALTAKTWSTWAKLWLDELLPAHVAKVVYLDCDTLVCAPLFEVADAAFARLESKGLPLAAVRDIGKPCGDGALSKYGFAGGALYFNAGVLLINLEVARDQRILESARTWALRHPGAAELPMRDQDVLNVVFRGLWLPLDFTLNLQGMGTYGGFRTRQDGPHKPSLFSPQEWAAMQLKPAIVHFTGTATPALSDFTCPHLKMATKPWAWFCHHPLKGVFWGVATRTQFGGLWGPEPLNEEAALAPDIAVLRKMVTDKHPSLASGQVD